MIMLKLQKLNKLIYLALLILLLLHTTTIDAKKKEERGFWSSLRSGIYNILAETACTFKSECCRPPSVQLSLASANLRKILKTDFFGQHIAVKTVVHAIEGHLLDENPKKPLVLSFHGWAGSGKTFLAHLIASSVYQLGVDSKYVKMYSASFDFPDSTKALEYKIQLQQDLTQLLQSCERALVVFDEVDVTPVTVFDGLVPFFDYSRLSGVNHKKAIYIFLSNIGSTEISNVALQAWVDGKKREDLTFHDFHKDVSKASFNAFQTGLEKTRIIERSLVDFFVPFLPMERKHVIECVNVEARRQNATVDAEAIADQMTYWPDDLQLFSRTGCKRVEALVGYAVSESKYKEDESDEQHKESLPKERNTEL